MGVDAEGLVSPGAVKAALTPETVLVTIMHSNNEVCVCAPCGLLARRCAGSAQEGRASKTPVRERLRCFAGGKVQANDRHASSVSQ